MVFWSGEPYANRCDKTSLSFNLLHSLAVCGPCTNFATWWFFMLKGLNLIQIPNPFFLEISSYSLVTQKESCGHSWHHNTITWWVCRLLMDSRDFFGGHVSKRPWIVQLFDPAVFIMIGWVILILHTCLFWPWIRHSDFNSRKQLHNPQKTAILHIFLGANGSIIFHHPWAVAPWRDMWPMWNFLGVLELRATTDGRQVSDSTPNHPIVMDDHDFVLKFVATWGTPILRNLRYFLVADEMLQLMAVQKPENGLVQKQRGSGRVLGVSAWWIPLAKKPG